MLANFWQRCETRCKYVTLKNVCDLDYSAEMSEIRSFLNAHGEGQSGVENGAKTFHAKKMSYSWYIQTPWQVQLPGQDITFEMAETDSKVINV